MLEWATLSVSRQLPVACFPFFSALFAGACLLGLSTHATADALDNWHWRNPIPPAYHLRSVVYTNNLFVVVGDSGTVLTSQNGTNWTVQSVTGGGTLSAVTHGNGRFVAVGSVGQTATSTDGFNWHVAATPTLLGLNAVA